MFAGTHARFVRIGWLYGVRMSSGWWEFVEQYMASERISQAEISRRMGVDSSVLTGWKNGRQPSTDNLRLMAAATGIPMLRLLVESGHLTEEEAGGTAPPLPERVDVDVVHAIEADPDLLPEAKRHLTSQYGLLLRIASPVPATPEKTPLRSVARKGTPRRKD